MTADPRAFDGPHDKREVRDGLHELQAYLKSDLYERLPRGEEAQYERTEKVAALPGDHGYRFEHRVLPRPGRRGATDDLDAYKPVSFDAGACNMMCSPLGWRVLMCYHHDDPTYGLNVAIFDPWGELYDSGREMGGHEAVAFVDRVLP